MKDRKQLAREALENGWDILPDNAPRWGRAFGLTPAEAQKLVDAERTRRERK